MPDERIQVAKGIPAAVVRSYKNPLYDAELIRTAASGNDLLLFQKPLGQFLSDGTTTKTLLHTNMKSAGQLGSPLSFDLFGFNVRLPKAVTLADYQEVYRTAVFTFTIGQDTVFLQVPMEEIPCGVETEGMGATDAPHNGLGTVDNYYRFDIVGRGLHINATENFQVGITFPSGGPTLTANRLLRVYLRGILFKNM
jgi:hypothetical protein